MNQATGFSVVHRNTGHWDILVKGSRVFRIRGGPGRYLAMDEREPPYSVRDFPTITCCMSFICDTLMYELIVAEGQTPIVIEGWNV